MNTSNIAATKNLVHKLVEYGYEFWDIIDELVLCNIDEGDAIRMLEETHSETILEGEV